MIWLLAFAGAVVMSAAGGHVCAIGTAARDRAVQFAGLLCACAGVFLAAQIALAAVAAEPADAVELDEPPTLTVVGVWWLNECETDGDYQASGRFKGAAQWELETWTMAATLAGWAEYVNTSPHYVPDEVQDHTARVWWSYGHHRGPATQWPHCYDDALRAMGFDAECDSLRNVYGCGAPARPYPPEATPVLAVVPERGAETNAPIPSFAGAIMWAAA